MTNNDADELFDRPPVIHPVPMYGGVWIYGSHLDVCWVYGHMGVYGCMGFTVV